jgi:hypothetical protein
VHDALGAWSYDAPPEPFIELREVCRSLYAERFASQPLTDDPERNRE